MAFDHKGLQLLAYNNAMAGQTVGSTDGKHFKLWLYRTEDARATVVADDYFLPAKDLMQLGDMIIVEADIDGAFAITNYAIEVVSKLDADEIDTASLVLGT